MKKKQTKRYAKPATAKPSKYGVKNPPAQKYTRSTHVAPHLSERAKFERDLGKKLLSGEIPVVPPNLLPRCPVPPTHVKEFDSLCRRYAAGEVSEREVIEQVNKSLHNIRPPQPQYQPPSYQPPIRPAPRPEPQQEPQEQPQEQNETQEGETNGREE